MVLRELENLDLIIVDICDLGEFIRELLLDELFEPSDSSKRSDKYVFKGPGDNLSSSEDEIKDSN